MAAIKRYSPWWSSELDALELLYNAGWKWPAIRAHLAGWRGVQRTVEAVRAKGKQIGVTAGKPRGHTPMSIADDLEDLMILGRSSREIAEELGVSQCTVLRHIRQKITPQRREAWKKGAKVMLSKAQAGRWAKARRVAV